MPLIAVDVMGGDHGPETMVEGALRAQDVEGLKVLLVGEPVAIRAALERLNAPQPWPAILKAQGAVSMDDAPVQGVKQNPDASVNVGLAALKAGRAQGFVTAGNSGAALVAAVIFLGRLPGVLRPGLAVRLPSRGPDTLLLDVGASIEANKEQLLCLAALGAAYAQTCMGREDPSVGVLSNGTEPGKGTPLIRQVMGALEGSRLRFAGPIEGDALFTADVDVVLCDGFVGNILLKGIEGAIHYALSLVGESLLGRGVEARTVASAIADAGRRVNYAEHGGALLLGVEGVVVVAHGRSDAQAVASAIRLAAATGGGRLMEGLRAACEPSPFGTVAMP